MPPAIEPANGTARHTRKSWRKTPSPADRAAAYAVLGRIGPQAKSAAKAVIQLNFDNMTPIEGR